MATHPAAQDMSAHKPTTVHDVDCKPKHLEKGLRHAWTVIDSGTKRIAWSNTWQSRLRQDMSEDRRTQHKGESYLMSSEKPNLRIRDRSRKHRLRI